MKGALIPAAMALVGLAIGGAAGHVLVSRAAEAPEGAAHAPDAHAEEGAEAAEQHGAPEPDEHAEAGHAEADHEEAGHVDPEPGGDDHGGSGHGKAAGPGGGHGDSKHASGETAGQDYVKLDNQFVVPVIEGGRTEALMMLALSLEIDPAIRAAVFENEPKLRDAFLRVMFDHANAGGFGGGFTAEGPIEALRVALRERARAILGPGARDVLIVDIARQDA